MCVHIQWSCNQTICGQSKLNSRRSHKATLDYKYRQSSVKETLNPKQCLIFKFCAIILSTYGLISCYSVLLKDQWNWWTLNCKYIQANIIGTLSPDEIGIKCIICVTWPMCSYGVKWEICYYVYLYSCSRSQANTSLNMKGNIKSVA